MPIPSKALKDKPVAFLVAQGDFTTAGGDAAESITVTGATTSDHAVVMLKTEGATPRTVDAVTVAANAINVTMSDDPSDDHVLYYQLWRDVTS